MTDKKMSDEQIIKALEWHLNDENNCDECPLLKLKNTATYCVDELLKSALDLINRKDAEIERLKEELDGETVKNMRLGHEVERLKEYEIAFKKGCALSRCINKGFIQNEAYNEFAQLLREQYGYYEFIEKESLYTNEDIESALEELTRNLHGTCTEGGNEDGMD